MAQTTADIYGIAKGANDIYNSPAGFNQQVVLNNRGDLLTALSLPSKAELTRLGAGWECSIATASAFTYAAAIPTTRAELVIYNGEAAGGKSLVIDGAWMTNVTTQAAANAITLMIQNVPAVATIPADDGAQLLNSLSGKASYGGKARKAVANTAAGQAANYWRVVASTANAATATVGLSVLVDLKGMYIVPPGGVFALAGVAGTAAGTAVIGVRWFEVQLTLG